jgi:hypothetical protein
MERSASPGSSGNLLKSGGGDKNDDQPISKRDILKQEALNIIFRDYVPKVKDNDGNTLEDEKGDAIVNSYSKVSYKVKAIRNLRTKIKWNDTIAAILAVAGLVLSNLEYEIYYTGEDINIDNLNATIYANQMTPEQAGALVMDR